MEPTDVADSVEASSAPPPSKRQKKKRTRTRLSSLVAWARAASAQIGWRACVELEEVERGEWGSSKDVRKKEMMQMQQSLRADRLLDQPWRAQCVAPRQGVVLVARPLATSGSSSSSSRTTAATASSPPVAVAAVSPAASGDDASAAAADDAADADAADADVPLLVAHDDEDDDDVLTPSQLRERLQKARADAQEERESLPPMRSATPVPVAWIHITF